MNEVLHLSQPDDSPEYHPGDHISLLLGNTSEGILAIDLYEDVQIYSYSETGDSLWVEIGNAEIYQYVGQYEQNLIYLPPTGPGRTAAGFSVYPKLLGRTGPVDLRIVIIAEELGDEGSDGEKTGAYIDVTLK